MGPGHPVPGGAEGLHRFIVAPGAAAQGTAISDLPLPEDAWVSFIIRGWRLVPVHAGTVLQAGDEVTGLAPGADEDPLGAIFTKRWRDSPP